jgi:asparagine synthetase B (glutamine-hydrolysing)
LGVYTAYIYYLKLLEKIERTTAVDILESRGPDYTRYKYRNNIFIAQAVLHITGTDDFYNDPRSDFLAYNGEIYNKRWFGYTDNNDVELVYSAVKDSLKKFIFIKMKWNQTQ